MNLDTSQSVGSSTASASTSSSKAPLPNGGCLDKVNCMNTNLSFPPGGYPSLRLPVVSYTLPLVIYFPII
jgi:serine/threonine-protein phosphatase 2A regulatory subunit B